MKPSRMENKGEVAETESKAAVRKKMAMYDGLCTHCKSSEGCTFPRALGRPVTQCEEFEGIEEHPVDSIEKCLPLVARKKGSPQIDDTGKFKGLCKTCENRDACSFPKPEGGVWHCEEYE